LDSERNASPDDRSFGLRLAFARYLPPQARLRLLERRRAQLAQRLSEARAAAAAQSRLDVYTRSLMEHTTDSTEQDISWLDRLIDAERSRAVNSSPSRTSVTGNTAQDLKQQDRKQREGLKQMEGDPL